MGDTVVAWDIEARKQVSLMKGNQHAVKHATFSPDGRRLATASEDAVCVFDTTSGLPVYVFKEGGGALHALFTADGRRLITTGSDGTARVRMVKCESRPREELLRQVQILSGSVIEGDDNISLQPMSPERFRSAWGQKSRQD